MNIGPLSLQMSDADDAEVDVSLPRQTVSLALTAVSTVASLFLGGGACVLDRSSSIFLDCLHVLCRYLGMFRSNFLLQYCALGFYYGMTTQKKALIEEEKSFGKTPKCTKEFKPKSASFFERKFALDKPLPPGTAAWKALLGVTVVSVAGCCVVVGGAAACLGLTNVRAA